MIYVETTGRLGNQMFQYAFARALQEKRPDLGQIIFIPENKSYEKYGGMAIMDFAVNNICVGKKPELTKKQRLTWLMFRMYRKTGSLLKGYAFIRTATIRLQPFLNRNGIYYYGDYDDVRVRYNAKSTNAWVKGLGENPLYFDNNKTLLRKEFTPLYESLPHNKELLDKIRTTNSVCVSIRRGDFLSDEYRERFNVCTQDYFYEAEKVMSGLLGSYQLFLFSDDIEWCRREMHFRGNVYYESNNGNDPVWEKMRLMSSCKHFIISNSTFSWWAQYLSNHPYKIVIAPRPWRKNEYHDCLYDESFILLDGSRGQMSVGPKERNKQNQV